MPDKKKSGNTSEKDRNSPSKILRQNMDFTNSGTKIRMILIRPEKADDIHAIDDLLDLAFAFDAHSSQNEA